MIRELRLGNIIGWIDRNHEVHIPITSVPKKVYQISIHECLVYKHDLSEYQVVDEEIQKIKFTDIYGIPLTEEWLINFGFVNDGVVTSRLKLDTDFGEALINLQNPRKLCKYVHQLQNLYFALTGKELELR